MSDKKGKRINSLQYHANTPKFILDMQAKLGGGNERRVRNPEDYNSEEEEEREDREDEKPQVVVLDEKKHLSQEEAEALKKRKRDEEREDIDAKTGKHTFRRLHSTGLLSDVAFLPFVTRIIIGRKKPILTNILEIFWRRS
eukprot:Colp12_sorted_trinity150504_noHs@27340